MTQRVKCFIVWRILPENSDWSEPVAVICTAPWCVTMRVYEQRRCAKRVAELRHRLEIPPAPESASHVKLGEQYAFFINGKSPPPTKGESSAPITPANEKKLAAVASATAEDVDKA